METTIGPRKTQVQPKFFEDHIPIQNNEAGLYLQKCNFVGFWVNW